MIDMLELVKKELSYGDLDLKHQQIARIIGLEKYIELCEKLGGSSYYLPSIRCISQNISRRKVIENRHLVTSKQMNCQQLAVKYGLCESTVYKLIKDSK